MSKLFAQVCCFVSIIVSLPALAQTNEASAESAAASAPAKADADNKTASTNASGKKMVREANINLRTTVTGNQEQPRVMYILPWQSPTSPDLEMEMLSSQQEAVFGHVERDEMQRSLEASGEWDDSTAE
ncbi:hypothetical protein D0C16_18740 [Cellvibrio sp. KY-GH-1]|uniref:hypothetical protein n=1 Tax=Cellvibrio sp. KY-GH-1 TaxID=2303332 RepID=UPI001249333F|nr:hypothetical protein [Cellvibrio sp. KY-GH-1]QEY17849.1 hypothetical protein D0C16_18740 [Cellvibrio sp. KY-GH-1]